MDVKGCLWYNQRKELWVWPRPIFGPASGADPALRCCPDPWRVCLIYSMRTEVDLDRNSVLESKKIRFTTLLDCSKCWSGVECSPTSSSHWGQCRDCVANFHKSHSVDMNQIAHPHRCVRVYPQLPCSFGRTCSFRGTVSIHFASTVKGLLVFIATAAVCTPTGPLCRTCEVPWGKEGSLRETLVWGRCGKESACGSGGTSCGGCCSNMFFVSMAPFHTLLVFISLCPLSAEFQPAVLSLNCLWWALAQLCFICCDFKYTWSLMGSQWLRNGWPGKTIIRHGNVGSFPLSGPVCTQVPLLFSECRKMHIREMWSLPLLSWDFPLGSLIQSINQSAQQLTTPGLRTAFQKVILHRKRDYEYKVIASSIARGNSNWLGF